MLAAQANALTPAIPFDLVLLLSSSCRARAKMAVFQEKRQMRKAKREAIAAAKAEEERKAAEEQAAAEAMRAPPAKPPVLDRIR